MLHFLGRFCGQPASKPFNQFLELAAKERLSARFAAIVGSRCASERCEQITSLSQMKNGRREHLP